MTLAETALACAAAKWKKGPAVALAETPDCFSRRDIRNNIGCALSCAAQRRASEPLATENWRVKRSQRRARHDGRRNPPGLRRGDIQEGPAVALAETLGCLPRRDIRNRIE